MASEIQLQKFWARAKENGVAEYIDKAYRKEILAGQVSLARLGVIMSFALEYRDEDPEQSIAQTGATTGAPGGTGAASQAPEKDFD